MCSYGPKLFGYWFIALLSLVSVNRGMVAGIIFHPVDSCIPMCMIISLEV